MLEEYFTPISNELEYRTHELGSVIEKHISSFPNITDKKIAIIGVCSKEKVQEYDKIRSEFYSLVTHTGLGTSVVDLGNIIEGDNPSDNQFAIKNVTTHLLKNNVLPILIGRHIDQGEAMYQGYETIKHDVNLSLISSHLPMLEYQVLHRICRHQPNFLQNINAIGFQAHYSPPKALDTLENLNFGHLRLGKIKTDIEEVELHLRHSDITLFDINSIKHSNAPGKNEAQPNGLTGEEACQITRYAGLSDTSSSIGFFGYDATRDEHSLTAKLIAQLMWYYIDGYTNRKEDTPELHSEFVKYRCDLEENQPPILFLKSKRTARWWMQIEHPADPTAEHHTLTFPCSYMDYQYAAAGELPERYLSAVKQLV